MRNLNLKHQSHLASIILIASMTFSNFAQASLSERLKGLFSSGSKKEVSSEQAQKNLIDFDTYYANARLKHKIENVDKKILSDQDKIESQTYGINLSEEYKELFPDKNEFSIHVKKANDFIKLLEDGKENPLKLKKYLEDAKEYLEIYSRMNKSEIKIFINDIDKALFFSDAKTKEEMIDKLLTQHLERRDLLEQNAKSVNRNYSVESFYNELFDFSSKNILNTFKDPQPANCSISYGFYMRQICNLLHNIDYTIKESKGIDAETLTNLAKYKKLYAAAVNKFEEKDKEIELSKRVEQNKIDINNFSNSPKSHLGKLNPINSDFLEAYQYIKKRFDADPSLINKSFDEIYLNLQRNSLPYREGSPRRKDLILGAVMSNYRPYNSSELATKDLKFIELFLKECIKKEKIDVNTCTEIFDSQNEKYYGANAIKQYKNKLSMILEKYYLKNQIKKDKKSIQIKLNYLIQRIKDLNIRQCGISKSKEKEEDIVISSPLVKPLPKGKESEKEQAPAEASAPKANSELEAQIQQEREKRNAEMKKQLEDRRLYYYHQAQLNLNLNK